MDDDDISIATDEDEDDAAYFERLDHEDNAHRALLQRAHREYKKLYAEQEAIRKSGRLAQVLAAAMARMPHARTLGISDVFEPYLPRPKLWNFPTRRGVGVYEAYYGVMRVPIFAQQARRRHIQPTNL